MFASPLEVKHIESNSNISEDNNLCCQLCFEKFNLLKKTPMIITCGHSLCKECTEAILKKTPGLIQCPFDRDTFSYSSVANVAINYCVLSMINSLEEQQKVLVPLTLEPGHRQCENHPEQKILYSCSTHSHHMCSICLAEQVDEGHTLVPARSYFLGEDSKITIDSTTTTLNSV